MTARSWWMRIVMLALLATGCASPVVGLECRDGYTRCDNGCFDLQRDEQSCGACGVECIAGQTCVEGLCTWLGDADGGTDGTDPGGLPPRCDPTKSQPNCVCGAGQLRCGNTCVDALIDADNCGGCGIDCGKGFCNQGSCVPDCGDLSLCGRACVNLQTSIDFCGDCGTPCPSGVCIDGACEQRVAGHIVLIGYDLTQDVPASLERLLGNAIGFLPRDDLTVTVFEDQSVARGVITNRVNEWASSIGREITVRAASPATVTFFLGRSQVFVIAAQQKANRSVLQKNGETWSAAMRGLLSSGGVIVLLDAISGSNGGTHELLEFAGLLDIDGIKAVESKTLELVGRNDAIASDLPARIGAPRGAVVFDTDESTAVLEDPSLDLPVVVHLIR